jgi:AcrR family transcriptional regulator
LDKKQQILTAALKLFVTHGFHGTPTSKIAEMARVANGTLFHHYKTKDELVVGLYNWVKEDLANSISAIIHESDFITPKFKNTFIHTLYWALSNRDKFNYIRQFESSPHISKISVETIKHQAAVLTQLFDEGIRKKLLQPHPPALIYTVYSNHMFGVYQYLASGDFDPAEEKRVINEAYEMVWEMLKYK